MIGTPLRHYRTTGRCYTTNDERDDVGRLNDEVAFSLFATPRKFEQQSLDPDSRLTLRIGAEPIEGGYAILKKYQCTELFNALVNPPGADDEMVRHSIRAEGQYINPWGPSPDRLSIEDNSQKRLSIFIEPMRVNSRIGMRVSLESPSTGNTPYVDLSPAQHTDLVHVLNEFRQSWPDYRIAQECMPDNISAQGSNNEVELPNPETMSEPVQTNLLGLCQDKSDSTTKV